MERKIVQESFTKDISKLPESMKNYSDFISMKLLAQSGDLQLVIHILVV